MENVIDDGLTVPMRNQLGYTQLDNSLVIAPRLDLIEIEGGKRRRKLVEPLVLPLGLLKMIKQWK
ncbi:hypothetical protein HYC85_028787 [Camellia sinensis]|uniref:Uncharacterized protein n=1 Tax=Camellia sinensis TaxID=4442 RepID=A0A7J7G039_CAMSI|nr:hypothetical protein HYC85_028787 [Camellia sinensis]